VILQRVRHHKWTLALFFVVVFAACSGRACSGCRSCTGVETCDECVKRCVDTQGVSPDICRGAACSSVCQPHG
jgi:hypothetical protein